MAKNSAYTGESAKDRAINIMDKFISKNNKKQPVATLSARRKDPDVPIHMWPLADQIEYWENRPVSERFAEQYPAYSYWIIEVQKQTKVHPTFFADSTSNMKSELQEMYSKYIMPKEAARELCKRGIY